MSKITVEVALQHGFETDEFESASHESTANSSFQIALGPAPETWQQWFEQWLIQLEPDLSPIQAYELGIRLTDDTEIQALNAQYRQKNQPTDVLAFAALEVNYPQAEENEVEPLYLGDLVISVETAQRQAADRGHSLLEEMAWLASHGLLHLLGWDHPDEASLQKMLHQQESLLQTVGLSVSYDEAQAIFD